jgi:hypothetical protein
MVRNFAPFGGTINDQDYIANLGGLESDSGDTRFLDQVVDVYERGKFEAAAHASELANLAGELLLALDPS